MITIPRKIYDRMIEHAKKGYPNEACGILAGPPQGAEVKEFFPMRNADESSISYFMDPREQLEGFKKMGARGAKLLLYFNPAGNQNCLTRRPKR